MACSTVGEIAVPQSRSDAGFFAPLRDLAAAPETELFFALVPYHPDDQPAGTTAEQIRHIDIALVESAAGSREWGICTECGMGRVAADDVPRLLDLHREILAGSALRGQVGVPSAMTPGSRGRGCRCPEFRERPGPL